MSQSLYLSLRGLVAGSGAYAELSDAAAASALNATTVQRTRRFLWREARRLAQMAGNWPLVVVRARQTPTLPPNGAQDYAILAAINAVSMDDDQEIDPANQSEWQAFCIGLGALTTSSDLSQEVADAIQALGAETISPAAEVGWIGEVTAADVAHAREMV
jgi:hypothetical protein